MSMSLGYVDLYLWKFQRNGGRLPQLWHSTSKVNRKTAIFSGVSSLLPGYDSVLSS